MMQLVKLSVKLNLVCMMLLLAGGAEASITKIGIGGFQCPYGPFNNGRPRHVHLFHLIKTVMVL